ncbi:MAG TPA: diacylglycerol kinase family protein [bacterium]|nr:diacylglycerol kinase family protein [bacterium]
MARQSFLNSLKNAAKGFVKTVRDERNLQIHLLATFLVLLAGAFFQVKIWEWIVLLLVCGSIIVLEFLNTIVEKVVDFMSPKMSSYVKTVKDMMAATVLVAAIGSVIIGILIFGPYILRFFNF